MTWTCQRAYLQIQILLSRLRIRSSPGQSNAYDPTFRDDSAMLHNNLVYSKGVIPSYSRQSCFFDLEQRQICRANLYRRG